MLRANGNIYIKEKEKVENPRNDNMHSTQPNLPP